MNLGTIELYENILWFVLLPITIIFCIVIMFFKNSKKRSKKTLFQLTYILFILYFTYSLCLSFYELFTLKAANINNKSLIIIWIIMSLLPGLTMIYFGRKYKNLKKED